MIMAEEENKSDDNYNHIDSNSHTDNCKVIGNQHGIDNSIDSGIGEYRRGVQR